MSTHPAPAGTTHLLRRLAQLTRGYWWAAPVLVVLGLLTALTEGIGIGLIVPLFAALFSETAGGDASTDFIGRFAAGLDTDERVALLVGLILLLAAIRSAILFTYEITAIRISGRITHRLRVVLLRQLLDVGYAFFAGRDRGRLFDIVRGETWAACELLMTLSRVVTSLCAIVVFGVLLMLISPGLTLGAALGALVIGLLVRLVVARARRVGETVVGASAALSRETMEALGSMRTVRLFGREKATLERFSRASDDDRVAAERVETSLAVIQPATEFLYAPVFLAILLAAWGSGMSFPTLVAYMVLLYRLQPHVRRVDHLRVEIAARLPVVEHIVALTRREDKPFIVSGERPCPRLDGDVVFDGVSFAYGSGGDAAVSGVSFRIRPKGVTAIVGESGAGKSTLVNLLFRLYDPTGGRILVGGMPLPEIDLAEWRARLAFSGQDTELIGATVREAISYGNPGATQQQIEEAARRAHADGFIARLPKGYDTLLDGGTRLSAGQRQRIALARALVSTPDILVLDEATSALDSISETLVQEALQELAGSLTMVVIAHRLSTIRDADHVIVMHDGRVVEEGHPRDLLERESGAFDRLWRLQSRAFDKHA